MDQGRNENKKVFCLNQDSEVNELAGLKQARVWRPQWHIATPWLPKLPSSAAPSVRPRDRQWLWLLNEKLERLNLMYTGNGKRQMQVENFSIENK